MGVVDPLARRPSRGSQPLRPFQLQFVSAIGWRELERFVPERNGDRWSGVQ